VTTVVFTLSILVAVASVVEAGDACCKSEAAKRALMVANPFVVKPSNWDDDDDGPWEAPKIAMVDLPAWYRLLYETRLGVMGAAPLLISGVIAAALLTTIAKPLFPTSVLRSLLGSTHTATDGNNFSTTRGNAVMDSIRGSIFGLLVPFCSCGALPLAMALKQEGISSSSIAAFVTAAQAAGIDSMFFTYGVFGVRVAILRLVAAGVLAFSVGMTLARHDDRGRDHDDGNTNNNNNNNIEKPSKESEPIADKGSCCGTSDGSPNGGGGCHDETPKAAGSSTTRSVVASLMEFVTTSVELFSSVAVWVFLGVVVSACASIWVPPTSAASSAHTSSINPFFSSTATAEDDGADVISVIQSIASRAGLFLVSLPMTICEHGIVSLADALRGIGFSAGTSVALIVTGPSTNAGTLLMLSRLNNRSSSPSSSSSSNWVFDAVKIASVILLFGVTLSYLADDFGSSILMERTETAPTTTTTTTSDSGGSFSLPGWLDENAVSLAGLFTVASIIQSSSLLFQTRSLQSSSSSCST
jgi:uncharacterized membrane protein YraQ (UPF0718 family)